ncbi:DUF6281 family protein [Saccharomonospora sp. NPDC046836]|uniref:DUF6281 family protein n=1 Tax=Saccharomonospora sp. NPDC046836 TaxID=3156921 RepID=UPI0033EB0960
MPSGIRKILCAAVLSALLTLYLGACETRDDGGRGQSSAACPMTVQFQNRIYSVTSNHYVNSSKIAEVGTGRQPQDCNDTGNTDESVSSVPVSVGEIESLSPVNYIAIRDSVGWKLAVREDLQGSVPNFPTLTSTSR